MTRQLPNMAVYAPEAGPFLKKMASMSIFITAVVLLATSRHVVGLRSAAKDVLP